MRSISHSSRSVAEPTESSGTKRRGQPCTSHRIHAPREHAERTATDTRSTMLCSSVHMTARRPTRRPAARFVSVHSVANCSIGCWLALVHANPPLFLCLAAHRLRSRRFRRHSMISSMPSASCARSNCCVTSSTRTSGQPTCFSQPRRFVGMQHRVKSEPCCSRSLFSRHGAHRLLLFLFSLLVLRSSVCAI